MIRVLCDDKLIYDSRLPEYTITSGVVTREDNRAGSFVFTVQKDHPNYNHLERMTPTVYVYMDDDPEPIFKGRIINDVDDFYGGRKFTCEGELSFLIDSIQRPYAFADSPEEYFKYFIRNHNSQVGTSRQFTIGSCTVIDPNNYINRSNSFYEDTLENLNSRLIEPLGGHIVFTHDAAGASTINYLAEFPERTTQTIRFGENLLTYARTLDSADIATAIIPLGAEYTDANDESHRLTIEDVNDGDDYIYNEEAVNQYGWIFKVVEWDDVTIAANLLAKARAYLAEAVKSTVSIELTAADLSAINKDIADFRLGDLIHVISKPHGIDDDYVLGKQTIDLLDPAKNTITLGRVYKTFTGNSKSVGKTAAAARAEAISAQARVDAVSTRAKAAQNVAAEAMPKFGTCSTAAGVAAKANDQTISGFALKVGATVSLLMSKANSVNAPTLNINRTGAKPIVIADGTPLDADNSAVVGWVDDSLITFVYDGTNWRIDDSAALTRIQHILTEDIVGTGGRINMKDGTFNYGNKLVWNGSQLTVDGNVTASTGRIGGWSLSSSQMFKEGTVTIDDVSTPYKVLMQAPESATAGQAAFAVRHGAGTTADPYTYPFIVRYNGKCEARNAVIEGDIVANSLTLGSGVTVPYSNVSGTPDLTVYVQKNGRIGSTPAEGATGFIVSSAGLLQASNAVIYGTLYSSKGKIGGWDISSTLIQKLTDAPTDGTQYNAFMQAPLASIGDATRAFGVQVREFANGVAGSWQTNFAVRYDGSLISTKGQIGGWTIGTNSIYKDSTIDNIPYRTMMYAPDNPVKGNAAFAVRSGTGTSEDPYKYPFVVHYDGRMESTAGTIGGWTILESSLYSDYEYEDSGGIIRNLRAFMQAPNGSPSQYVFGVRNMSASENRFYVDAVGVCGSAQFVEAGIPLAERYALKPSGMAADGTTVSAQDATWESEYAGDITVKHKYLCVVDAEFAANGTGVRALRATIGGTTVGNIATDRRQAISGYSTHCRTVFWIQPMAARAPLNFEFYQNSGGPLDVTYRYQLIDFGT